MGGRQTVARSATTTAAVIALAAAFAAPASAQLVQTRVTGSAISVSGERVVGAQVRVIGSMSQPAVTGEDGNFELFVLGDTVPRIVLRRIGFRPETVLVHLPQPATPALIIRLTRAIQMVRPVVVNAVAGEANTMLGAIRDRQRTGGNGYFVYRDDFMKSNPARFSDILRRVPGIQLARTQKNFTEVRLRNLRCAPLLWLDGQPLLGIPFDPDLLPPETIEAIEVYSSPSLVPPRFQGPPYAQGCGALVIWTRRGERPIRRPTIDADSIVHLLDAQRVFVANEVDTPAKVVSVQEPEYPDSLRAAGISGSAVIEFIIDADGKINKESIGVVSATHMRFADAVRIAVLDATFQPAIKAQRAVAQVYQLPVTFTAPKP